MRKSKQLQVPAAMRDAQSLEENSPEGSDSENDLDQVSSYLPSKSPSANSNSGPTSTSAIDLLIQRTRGPRFGDADNSYHFSDEDETTQATSDPLEKLYLWVKTLQSHEKRNQELLRKLHSEAKQHQNLRMGVILLCALTVFLSLANIGTSLVAARLSKDTTVSGDDLVSMGGVRLGTTSKDVVVNMMPLDASKRRALQVDSNDPAMRGNFCTYARDNAACNVEGTVTSSSAKLLYDSFCPGFQELGYCSGEGVDRLILNCNGRLSTIFGGPQIPPTPPTEVDGFVAYPTDGRGYVGEAAVYLFGRVLPCVQPFTVAMYCPTEEENMLTTMTGEPSDECLVFLAWEPGTCIGKVELCGAPTEALS
jgi:hypothetical protein